MCTGHPAHTCIAHALLLNQVDLREPADAQPVLPDTQCTTSRAAHGDIRFLRIQMEFPLFVYTRKRNQSYTVGSAYRRLLHTVFLCVCADVHTYANACSQRTI
jgi:hypothetical protein